jgi:hypothetical protein
MVDPRAKGTTRPPSRMHIRLTELGLTRRCSWEEVADIQADHEADLASAVDQALEDAAFDDWWHGRNDVLRAERVKAIYQMLSTDSGADHKLNPERPAARARVLELFGKHREAEV